MVRITDVTGTGTSASGSIDVDGAVTLNSGLVTPVVSGTWGGLKATFR